MGKRIALLIGNDEYNDENLGNLPSSRNDIMSMASILGDESRGQFDEVPTIINAAHYQAQIQISTIFSSIDSSDFLLIYFSGHGMLDPAGQLHLCAKNTDTDHLNATAIPFASIKTAIEWSAATKVLILLDCCYSGAANNCWRSSNKAPLVQEFDSVADIRGTYIITASSSLQLAGNHLKANLGLFTKYLVEGIETGGADLNNDGKINVDELFTFISEKVTQCSSQTPTRHCIDNQGSLTIALSGKGKIRKERAHKILKFLKKHKDSITPNVYIHATNILVQDADELSGQEGDYNKLLDDFFGGELEASEFSSEWIKISPDLEGADENPLPLDARWKLVQDLRSNLWDNIVPCYILDENFFFLDWNPAFDQMFARPLRLQRNMHAQHFVVKLANAASVIERSKRIFTPGEMPMVDLEELSIQLDDYGLIRMRKLAAQIYDQELAQRGWSVILNIESVEKNIKFWSDLESRLKRDNNWSRYAKSYDSLLLNFDGYSDLINKVLSYQDDSEVCADLGMGTGNLTFKLLESPRTREIWGFDSNEDMLENFRQKIKSPSVRRKVRNHLRVVKGDLYISLQEMGQDYFDTCFMINVLYSLERPRAVLRQVYRVLKKGGRLVLTTSHKDTDVDKLFDRIRIQLTEKGLWDKFKNNYCDAYDRHQAMIDQIRRDSVDDILAYLSSAGFSVQEGPFHTYEDSVVLIIAEKSNV